MGGNSPCASCKLLRRRCAKECIFAPFFPSDEPHKFAIVHKVFGASNVNKMLQELTIHDRADAVSSLVYEANARVRDPVYGCVGAISYLQNQISQLQMQLAVAQAEILCIQMQKESLHPYTTTSKNNNTTGDDNKTQKDGSKSFFITNNLTGLPQFINFSSSANVTQETLLKRQSLWT